jgi:peptidoglycan/LPS O-acetylase OafA/YrhL
VTEPSRLRIRSLDALRGIAAFAVMTSHCFGDLGPAWLFAWTPLGPFHDGRASVILFFVLSGLALSLARARESWQGFLVRRVVRIWVPFAMAVLAAAGLSLLVPHRPVPGMGEAFNTTWTPGMPTLRTVVDHLLMLGRRVDTVLDGPVWSLAHELRISLIFPLLLLAQARLPRLVPLMALGASVFVASRWGGLFGDVTPWYASTPAGSLQITAYYVLFFTFGIGTVLHREAITRLVARRRGVLWLAALACFWAVWPSRMATDLLYGVGATLLIWLVMGSARATALLEIPQLQWLGRISYSLYLVHVPVLQTMVRGLDGIVPGHVVVWFVPPVALLAAHLFHVAVEAPSIALARRLGSRVGRGGLRVAQPTSGTSTPAV